MIAGSHAMVRWLRGGSAVTLLFAFGHALGGLKSWSPVATSPALEAMRAYRFDVEGVNRTFLDFYRGFGFSLGVYMLLQAVILWQLAAIARHQPAAARPIVGACAVASLALTGIAWALIMPVPALFSATQTLCIGAAWLAGRSAADDFAAGVAPARASGLD